MKIQQTCTISLAFHFQWCRPRAFTNYGNCAYYNENALLCFWRLQRETVSWRESPFGEFYRKIHCLKSEFHVKFHVKNRYRTNREAMSAISVFQVKFNVEFTSQAVNFS